MCACIWWCDLGPVVQGLSEKIKQSSPNSGQEWGIIEDIQVWGIVFACLTLERYRKLIVLNKRRRGSPIKQPVWCSSTDFTVLRFYNTESRPRSLHMRMEVVGLIVLIKQTNQSTGDILMSLWLCPGSPIVFMLNWSNEVSVHWDDTPNDNLTNLDISDVKKTALKYKLFVLFLTEESTMVKEGKEETILLSRPTEGLEGWARFSGELSQVKTNGYINDAYYTVLHVHTKAANNAADLSDLGQMATCLEIKTRVSFMRLPPLKDSIRTSSKVSKASNGV